MKTQRFVLVPLVAVLLVATHAEAQVSVQISVPLIRFETAPRLVVVSPGIQVVEDYDDEVYFVDSYYWVRRDDRWYRARDYRGGWVHVDRGVPGRLVTVQPGRYRHYRGARAVAVEPAPRGVVVVKQGGKKNGKHNGKGRH